MPTLLRNRSDQVSGYHRHQATGKIRLSEVIAALSFALDLTEGQPEGHATRSLCVEALETYLEQSKS